MTDHDWAVDYAKAIGMWLNGGAIPDPGPHGEQIRNGSFYLICNAGHEPIEFTLPGGRWGDAWAEELRTTKPAPEPVGTSGGLWPAGATIAIEGNELILLRRSR